MKPFTVGETCVLCKGNGPKTSRFVGTPVHILVTPKSINWRDAQGLLVLAGWYVVGTHDNSVMSCAPSALAPFNDSGGNLKIDWADCLFEPYRGRIDTKQGRQAMFAHVVLRTGGRVTRYQPPGLDA